MVPNWCEGSLRIRGNSEDILKFLRNTLVVYHGKIDHEMNPPEYVEKLIDRSLWCEEEEEMFEGITYHYIFIKDKENPHIEGTHRGFVMDEEISFRKSEKSCVALHYEQAWTFNSEEWVKFSKEYGLDFRLYGVDQGACFVQEIEVIHGRLTVCKNDKYGESFDWDCLTPWLGG